MRRRAAAHIESLGIVVVRSPRQSAQLAAALPAPYCVSEAREARVQAQGWYRDPYEVHEYRYFSDGRPTKLVRDGGVEGYDPPPPGPPEGELVEIPATEPGDGTDMRRADDRETGTAYDPSATAWSTIDVAGFRLY